MWCGVNRQRAERSRALGPVRPTSDATRAANAAQPTARRRRQRRRPTHPRNTHERAATSDATNTTTTSSRCRCHGTAARLRGGRTHEECSAGGALQAGAIEKGPHDPSKLHQHRPHRPSVVVEAGWLHTSIRKACGVSVGESCESPKEGDPSHLIIQGNSIQR